jgi:aryl-alcohol dehydrogenase
MQVKAAVLRDGHGPFSVETLELGDPAPDEVLVRVVAAGMCHTDLLSRELPPEFFLGATVYGHEGAGVVEAVGSDVDHVTAGDHVVLSFTSCQSCPACAAARPASCFDFQLHNMAGGRLDGTSAFTDANGERVGSHFFGQSSFASHTIANRHSVVKVDPHLDLTKLGPLGCSIQTGAGTVFNILDVQPGSSFVVAGAGALGLASVMAAKEAGATTIVAIDRHQSRLDLATRFGATEVLSGDPSTFAPAIHEITGRGSDTAFDTTGNAALVRALYEGLNNIGVLSMAGVGFGDVTFDFLSMIGGKKIAGSMEGDAVPATFIPHLARLNADGRFPFDELITEFSIDDINDAEAASASGEVIKPVLTF